MHEKEAETTAQSRRGASLFAKSTGFLSSLLLLLLLLLHFLLRVRVGASGGGSGRRGGTGTSGTGTSANQRARWVRRDPTR